MRSEIQLVLAVSLLGVAPLTTARAACDTETARETTQIRYSQAMAAWQEADPTAYDAAHDQLRSDAVKAKRGGEVKLCQFWEKAIKASHNKE